MNESNSSRYFVLLFDAGVGWACRFRGHGSKNDDVLLDGLDSVIVGPFIEYATVGCFCV